MVIDVIVDGSNAGKIYIDEQKGFPVDVAIRANLEKFEETLIQILTKNESP